MDDYQNFIYYVYSHTDPRTDELIYIGHGCRGRAWIHGSRKTCLRSQEHLNHLESLTGDGFVASDWVSILLQGTDKKSAAKREQELIRLYRPRYNKPQGQHILRFTEDKYQTALEMRGDGMPYSRIARELDLSVMTVYRGLNGQTKNMESYIDTNE